MTRISKVHFIPKTWRAHINPLILAVLTLFCAQNTGCEIPGLETSEQKIENIKQAISENDFERAHKLLDSAKHGVSSDDEHHFMYNEAVVAILEGNCDEGLRILNQVLHNKKSEINEHEIIGQLKLADQDKDYAHFHLASAVARICPTKAIDTTDNEAYRDALKDLYLAFINGLDVRSQIKNVLKFMIPDCTTFIPETQKLSSSPENATLLKDSDELDFILCSDGIWLKHQLRAHEDISATVILKPLNRKIWMDDSSKLPFIQLHVDLLEMPENDKTFAPPVINYIQPLPEIPPTDSDYQKLTINLPTSHLTKDGIYYVHLYPLNHGEADVSFQFNKTLDCAFIDDELTYTKDLKRQVVTLKDSDSLDGLTLCSKRPDAFTFDLEPGQKALLTIITAKDKDSEDYPKISVHVQDETKRQLVPVDKDQEDGSSIEFIDLKYNINLKNAKLLTGLPEIMFFQNITDQKHQYQVELANTNAVDILNYHLDFNKSTDCKDAMPERIIQLDVSEIEKRGIALNEAKWICPNQTLIYQPKLATENTILRASETMYFVSPNQLQREQVTFESFMVMDDDGKKYHIETAKEAEVRLLPDKYVTGASLNKPLLSSTVIHETSNVPGFSLVFAEMLDNNQQEEEESKDSNDEEKQEDKKDQRDKVNKQDAPNKSPDKPSDSPTSARGAGDDTQGDESNPDNNASGKKASAYDASQYEKEHIDALMDEIERGMFYVPLSGNQKEIINDKDW